MGKPAALTKQKQSVLRITKQTASTADYTHFRYSIVVSFSIDEGRIVSDIDPVSKLRFVLLFKQFFSLLSQAG
jgi:hypothetical protein